MAERIKYGCSHCKFKFTRNKAVDFKHCPYCGRTGTVTIDEGNKAGKLLEEVSGYDRM